MFQSIHTYRQKDTNERKTRERLLSGFSSLLSPEFPLIFVRTGGSSYTEEGVLCRLQPSSPYPHFPHVKLWLHLISFLLSFLKRRGCALSGEEIPFLFPFPSPPPFFSLHFKEIILGFKLKREAWGAFRSGAKRCSSKTRLLMLRQIQNLINFHAWFSIEVWVNLILLQSNEVLALFSDIEVKIELLHFAISMRNMYLHRMKLV